MSRDGTTSVHETIESEQNSTALYHGLALDPLKPQIRLLHLSPADNNQESVACKLTVHSLYDQPQYEALSYCWGEPGVTELIKVSEHPFHATANLAAALRALRLRADDRTFWIDAVCINQDDLREKEVQVSRMREIYASCARTVIWLGPSDMHSHKAFYGIKKKGRASRQSLTAVLSRPWFRRVWVIQEVAFATEVIVQCGPDVLGWDELVAAFSGLSHMSTLIDPSDTGKASMLHPVYYTRIMNAARSRILRGERFELLEALRSFRAFDATRPVDKVFGIIGLLSKPEAVNADYAKPAHEVYRDVALTIINDSQSLDILLDALQNLHGPKVPQLPSWVPDWSDVEHVMEKDLMLLPVEEPFWASRGTRVEGTVDDNGALQICVQFMSRIVELADRKPTVQEIQEKYWPAGRYYPRRKAYLALKEVVDIFQSWKDVACRTGSEKTQLYHTGETILEALYNTMQNRGPPFAALDKSREFDKWVHSMELSISLYRWHAYHVARWLPWPLVWAVTGPWSGFLALYLASQVVRGKFVVDPPEPEPNSSRQGWVPGRTENGLLGLFPAPDFSAPNTAPSFVGDHVVFIKGAARPYVLRPHGEHWKLIGDAYLHGVMHGAAFDQSKCTTISLI